MNQEDNQEKVSKRSESKGIERRDFLQGLATVPVLGVFGYALLSKIKHDKLKTTTQSQTDTAAVSDVNVALLGAGAQGQVLLNDCLKTFESMQLHVLPLENFENANALCVFHGKKYDIDFTSYIKNSYMGKHIFEINHFFDFLLPNK